MPWQYLLPYLVDHPVGVALTCGEGVSGKLCHYDDSGIYLMEYLHPRFTTKFYPYNQVQNMKPFPSYHQVPSPY